VPPPRAAVRSQEEAKGGPARIAVCHGASRVMPLGATRNRPTEQ
jgi:hypothetical protein